MGFSQSRPREFESPLGRTLWEWNGVDTSQFTQVYQHPSATGSLSVAAAPAWDGSDNLNYLKYTHTLTAYAYYSTVYTINDLPSDLPDRFILEFRMGPRATADRTIPRIVTAWQDSSHCCYLSRDSTATNLFTAICNGTGIDVGTNYKTVLTATNNSSEGDYFKILCDYREPDASHDPGVSWLFDHVSSQTDKVLATDSGYTSNGGASPPSSGWDSGWRTGGTIKNLGITFVEYRPGGAGSGGYGWIGQFLIREWKAL